MVDGRGARIGSTSDHFYFLQRRVTGDVTIVARVNSIENTNSSAKAGVMIREALTSTSRHALALVTPSKGIGFHRRESTGGSTAGTNISGNAPVWLRLVRSGSTITASRSSNGTSWSTISSDRISMGSAVYVGLAVASYNQNNTATASFSQVSVTGSESDGGSEPDGPLPSGWNGRDIGSPSADGSAAYSAGTFMVRGAGADIWGTSDQLGFVYRQVSGDLDIVARVGTFSGPDPWSKAGVMVRASLNANSAHASLLVSIGNGVAFQRRPSTGLSSLHTSGGSGTAPVWLKLERRGTAVTAFRSSDGSSWTMIGSESLSLPSSFYVGLAVTSHDESETAVATFTNVTTGGSSSPAPTPPTVSLTAPSSGSTYTAPASVSIAANATDPDGVAMVEFYANGNLLGTDATSPYAYSWSNVSAGTYNLTAVARDNRGAVATSSARSITVNGGSSNTPPTVSLTAPASGSTYTAPASVSVTADASDADGIAAVEFYANGNLLGSDSTSPYAYNWSGVSAGTYSLTAIARDTRGATTTSGARSITVNGGSSNTPPTVSLTAPASGSSYSAPASVTITANAADPGGSVTRVDFYAGSTLLGSDTSSPYSYTWNNVVAGNYSLTAVARDNLGATTTSAARTIAVNAVSAPTRAVFSASPDHSTVTRYVLDIFTPGTNPGSTPPIATQDLGRPSVSNGECNVSIASLISALPGGNYFATIVAIGPGGTSTRATSGTFSR